VTHEKGREEVLEALRTNADQPWEKSRRSEMVEVKVSVRHIAGDGKPIGASQVERVSLTDEDFRELVFEFACEDGFNPSSPYGLPETDADRRRVFALYFRYWLLHSRCGNQWPEKK